MNEDNYVCQYKQSILLMLVIIYEFIVQGSHLVLIVLHYLKHKYQIKFE